MLLNGIIEIFNCYFRRTISTFRCYVDTNILVLSQGQKLLVEDLTQRSNLFVPDIQIKHFSSFKVQSKTQDISYMSVGPVQRS